MRTGISIYVTAEDRRRLEAIVLDRNTPQKHVWRARFVLLTTDGSGTTTIMHEARASKTAVWRRGALHDRGRGGPPARQDTAARTRLSQRIGSPKSCT